MSPCVSDFPPKYAWTSDDGFCGVPVLVIASSFTRRASAVKLVEGVTVVKLNLEPQANCSVCRLATTRRTEQAESLRTPKVRAELQRSPLLSFNSRSGYCPTSEPEGKTYCSMIDLPVPAGARHHLEWGECIQYTRGAPFNIFGVGTLQAAGSIDSCNRKSGRPGFRKCRRLLWYLALKVCHLYQRGTGKFP